MTAKEAKELSLKNREQIILEAIKIEAEKGEYALTLRHSLLPLSSWNKLIQLGYRVSEIIAGPNMTDIRISWE